MNTLIDMLTSLSVVLGAMLGVLAAGTGAGRLVTRHRGRRHRRTGVAARA